jgi:hypothetical protein
LEFVCYQVRVRIGERRHPARLAPNNLCVGHRCCTRKGQQRVIGGPVRSPALRWTRPFAGGDIR